MQFSKVPVSQDALHGRSAILRCEVSEPTSVQYSWIQDGRPVQDSDRRFQEGSNLKFTAVDRHLDAGSFQCVAFSSITGDTATSSNASFNIKCEFVERFTERFQKSKLTKQTLTHNSFGLSDE